jgi:hypothetical protein
MEHSILAYPVKTAHKQHFAHQLVVIPAMEAAGRRQTQVSCLVEQHGTVIVMNDNGKTVAKYKLG